MMATYIMFLALEIATSNPEDTEDNFTWYSEKKSKTFHTFVPPGRKKITNRRIDSISGKDKCQNISVTEKVI